MTKEKNIKQQIIHFCKKHETKLFLIVVGILLCIIIYPAIFGHRPGFDKPRDWTQDMQNKTTDTPDTSMMFPGMGGGRGMIPRD